MHFYMPTQLITGENCIRQNSSLLPAFGRRCLVVTGQNSARQCGALADVEAALGDAGISFTLFEEIGPNPLLSICARAARRAREEGAQFVLGIGGGSPQDASKAIALLAANPQMRPEDLFTPGAATHPALPVVLVGTTAGTGSEATQYAVLTNDQTGRKAGIANPRGFAQLAFGDPRYMQSLPYGTTVSTALDALTHLVEAYFNKKASPITDLLCLEGIRILCAVLPAIRGKTPGQISLAQREMLYRASVYGGIAIAQNGTAYCHSLGYFLTEQHGIPHGMACAAFLPGYLHWCAPLLPGKYQQMLQQAGLSAGQLDSLILSLAPPPALQLDAAEREAIVQRYVGNKNFLATPGDFGRTAALAAMEALFA